MKKTLTQHSGGDLEAGSMDLIRNAEALHPNLPAAILADLVANTAEANFLGELDQMLRVRHFVALIRKERAAQRREKMESGWLYPELRTAVMTLPSRIPIGGGKTVPRDEIRFADTGRYILVLQKELRDKRDTDRRILAVQAIRKLWPRAQRRARRMTVAEVDAIRAKKAGLID